MSIYMPAPGGNFEQPPEGSHIGVCYRAIDLGTQRNEYKGEVSYRHQLMLIFELPDEKMSDGRPFSVSRWYTLSGHPKSNLRRDLEAWRGATFRDEEIEDFDIARLLGVGCMLGVIHADGTGRARITTIMRLPKGVKAPAPVNDPIAFSLDDRPFDHANFGKLSEKMQELIRRAPEYEAAIAGRDPHEEPPPPNGQGDYGGRYGDLDDEIPF